MQLIPVLGDIYNSTISRTERLCGGGTSASKHVCIYVYMYIYIYIYVYIYIYIYIYIYT